MQFVSGSVPILNIRQLVLFFAKVNIRNDSECHIWLGRKSYSGYGVFGIDEVKFKAHRIAYFMHYGTNIKGLVVCHTCDNRLCVNPAHLFVGTQTDNMLDCVRKQRVAKGEDYARKLKQLDVAEILRLHNSSSVTQIELGRMFGVSATTINYIIKRKIWKHLKY